MSRYPSQLDTPEDAGTTRREGPSRQDRQSPASNSERTSSAHAAIAQTAGDDSDLPG